MTDNSALDEIKSIQEAFNNAPSSNYLKYRGKCKEACEELIKQDPTLILVRGHYYCPIWDKAGPHWWCVTREGEIVDPTRLQFPSEGAGEYAPFTGVCTCEECGREFLEDALSPSNCVGSHITCSYECFGRYIGMVE